MTEAEDAICTVVDTLTPEQRQEALEGLLLYLRYECPVTKRPPVGRCDDKPYRTLERCARCVLIDVDTHGAATHAEIAARTGLSQPRVRKACRELERGPGYVTVRQTVQYGLGLHGSGAVMAREARRLETPRLPLEVDG